MSAALLEWKQLLADVLQEAKIIPLWGSPPPFPWEEFAEALSKEWNLPGLQIKSLKTSWNKKQEALRGLGTQPLVIPLEVAPLEGYDYLAISKEDMLLLTQAALQPSPSKETLDVSLARGFYQFLLLKALRIFSESGSYPDLHIKMAEDHPLPSEPFLTCDIALSWETGRIYAKLLLSRSFLAGLRDFYRVESTAFLQSPAAAHLSVPLSLVVGYSSLPLTQWKQANVGDFLRLDTCTLSPVHKSGKAQLFLYETPLFAVAIKKGKVSLLDYAFYQEESNSMKDEYLDESGEAGGEEEEFPAEEEMEGDVEEGEYEEEIPPSDEESDELASSEETPEEYEAPPASSEDMQQVIASAEIPITLVVEVARLSMTLNKLLEMQPGNVLELAVHTDNGVRLCTGGKCVATGELIALGETVGVKITKIGP